MRLQTMAKPTTRPLLGCCGSPSDGGSLLLLLFSLGWMPSLSVQAAETGQEMALLHEALASTHDFARLPSGLFLGLTCEAVSGLSTERVQELAVAVGHKNVTLQVDQLRCLARHLPKNLAPEHLDAFPLDLLLFLNPAVFVGPQACTHFFSLVSKANIDLLPQGAPERQRLLPAALSCLGVNGSRVSETEVRSLGGLACDLPGRFVAESAESLLPWLAGCQGPLAHGQEEAVRAVLRNGGPPYGPPSMWSVLTLDALQGLVAVLDESIVRSIPKRVTAAWLRRSTRGLSWLGSKLTAVFLRFRRDTEGQACPPGRKPQTVTEDLIFYENWELEACVDGAMVAAQMEHVNGNPFTNEQLEIFKRRLDETYPQGYPESLIKRLGYFLRYVSPRDIHRWNVTAPETIKAVLRASQGLKMDAQVTALIVRYLLGGGPLDEDTLQVLANIRPTYLCNLSPEELSSVSPRVLWLVGPQDLDTCGQRHLDVLYPKARAAFQNTKRTEYIERIRAFLGGASVDDLRALSQQNASLDLATFKRLRVDALVQLSVTEVQKLLGPHITDLKAEEDKSPVRDWIVRQRQEALDGLGLGLQGGVPNGYLVLDLSVREAFSRGAPLLGPGHAFAWVMPLLLALTLG